MAYAYRLYGTPSLPPPVTPMPLFQPDARVQPSENVHKSHLLPLLLTLRSLHPRDLPNLLLLSCTYFVLGDYESSLATSYEILSIDPSHAEAMSNIGTTLNAMGRGSEEAYVWWWGALQSCPVCFDAMDNIIAMLFKQAQDAQDSRSIGYYRQALNVCDYVRRQIISADGQLNVTVPNVELYRLQRFFFTTATLDASIDQNDVRAAVTYFSALELVVRPPSPYLEHERYTVRDTLLSTCIAGYIISASSDGPMPLGIIESLHIEDEPSLAALVTKHSFNLYHAVHEAGDKLLTTLLHLGGGVLPSILLLPDEVALLPMILFPFSAGILPSICCRSAPHGDLEYPPEETRQQTNVMTSVVLLTLANKFHENWLHNVTIPGLGESLDSSISLVILFYYLALALNPRPSTYNNLGILLSTITSTRMYKNIEGSEQVLSGSMLAGIYYHAGLKIDPNHPHLLTNLGSLLKDQGQIEQAADLYRRAVQNKPDYDIALANLGDAVKDMGRAWDAIEYYERAMKANPNLPEAICGLAYSLCSVCDWRGRGSLGSEVGVDEVGGLIPPTHMQIYPGWVTKLLEACTLQLDAAYLQSIGAIKKSTTMQELLSFVAVAKGRPLQENERLRWHASFSTYFESHNRVPERINEASFIIRFIDWLQPRLQRQWYVKAYGKTYSSPQVLDPAPNFGALFTRPPLPGALSIPAVPSVLPFHTFTYPMSPRMTRLIAHRNALRISYMALSQPWIPRHVFRPPRPPLRGKLNVGYISNDVNNHPLSHLMQSVFAFHDRDRFNVFLYTTSPWDGTCYRPKISREVYQFIEVDTWPANAIIEHIIKNEIHILINLGGYTKGARNDIFAARPSPVQMQLMGFAGTLAGGWCDYLVCDPIACPPETSATELWHKKIGLSTANPFPVQDDRTAGDVVFDFDADADPESSSEEWTYTEKFLYMPHTFMVTDHKQSFRQDESLSVTERAEVPMKTIWHDEEVRRTQLRELHFPDLPQDVVIFANFNQLYKIDPGIFAVWLRILTKVPRSIMWLLRFPPAGEEHILRTAKLWAGDDVASRIRFTGVARKDQHVHRSRVADLFLDTTECNAHTIAADVLWTGTPILTFPKYVHKMCSRVAASIANATGFGDQMVVSSMNEYESRAIALANGLQYTLVNEPDGTTLLHGQGELIDLRRNLFLNRDVMPLFDTIRWTRNIEKGFIEAWRRWVEGTQYEMSDEWEACQGQEKESGCIWITDAEPLSVTQFS
ncbi:TPR-like protein [Sparassis latifolia]